MRDQEAATAVASELQSDPQCPCGDLATCSWYVPTQCVLLMGLAYPKARPGCAASLTSAGQGG